MGEERQRFGFRADDGRASAIWDVIHRGADVYVGQRYAGIKVSAHAKYGDTRVAVNRELADKPENRWLIDLLGGDRVLSTSKRVAPDSLGRVPLAMVMVPTYAIVARYAIPPKTEASTLWLKAPGAKQCALITVLLVPEGFRWQADGKFGILEWQGQPSDSWGASRRECVAIARMVAPISPEIERSLKQQYADAMSQPGPEPTPGDASALLTFAPNEEFPWPCVGEIPIPANW